MAALTRAVGDLCRDPDGSLRPFLGSLLFDAPVDSVLPPQPWLRHGLVAAAALEVVLEPAGRWIIRSKWLRG